VLGPEPPGSTESKFRFLYLGNDLKLIAAVRKVLSEPEYRLVACGDRGGAELFLKSDIHYDALLIDFEWRGKEGLNLAELARSLGHRKRIPILVVAAAPLTGELQKEVRKTGVKKIMTKRPDVAAVTDAIRQLVETPSRKN
jgi:CheY-like chemotaxis protein